MCGRLMLCVADTMKFEESRKVALELVVQHYAVKSKRNAPERSFVGSSLDEKKHHEKHRAESTVMTAASGTAASEDDFPAPLSPVDRDD